jgi:hypothetical protein
MKLKTIAIAHHRNGIDGAPFHVVLFKDGGDAGDRKLAVLFDLAHHCAVLDVAKLASADLAFGSNSWRGDQYEPYLRQVIRAFQAGELATAADLSRQAATRPAIAVVSVRCGLVQEVRANQPLHVLIEDWDSTDVRPSREPMTPEPMLPAEEAVLIRFFQPATNQED